MIEHWVEFIELNTNVMTCQESHEHTWSFNDQVQYQTKFMDFIIRSYHEFNCLFSEFQLERYDRDQETRLYIELCIQLGGKFYIPHNEM